MTQCLDISIGPVQAFVSQSRRTRDLWGSSFLLAFLSAHAMRGAEHAGGRVVQPIVDHDPLYRWVGGDQKGPPPRIGSVPNHFVIELSGEPTTVAAEAEKSLIAAWTRVCDAVWARYVGHANDFGLGTSSIWQRQIRSFWELTWTAGPLSDTGGLLARRKHWRTHRLPDEPGDKCTVMHELQELSGHVRSKDSEHQYGFWARIRGELGSLDMRDNERLCAIAFVKRLFARKEIAVDAVGWRVDASHWPSTVCVGALPWIRDVVAAVPHEAREYADTVRRHAQDVFSERRPPFSGLNVEASGDFPKLDANYLHDEFVASERRCPLRDQASHLGRDELVDMLERIYKAEDGYGRRLGRPPVFYALLLADGDRLGELVRQAGGQVVGRALASFTGAVPGAVTKHDGVTVYAGGDDVLAMLPGRRALTCAADLSDAYRAAFAGTEAGNRATLSGAVVFAHVRLPLRSVLDEAHRLLDRVAKEGNGRNSLAAAVLKSSGPYCQWVTTWTRAGGTSSMALIDGLVQQLEPDTEASPLSSSLVYRIRDLLTRLCGWDRWQPGEWRDVPTDLQLRPFLYAEILQSLDARTERQARTRADDLTDRICAALSRSHATETSVAVGFDALLLARFLADREQQESDR